MSRRRHPSLWTDRPDDWPEARHGRRREDPPTRPLPREPSPRLRAPEPPVEPPTERIPTEPPSRHPRRRRTALAVGLVALLAGTVGAVGVLALGDDDPQRATATTVAPPLPAAGGTIAPSSDARLYAQANRAVVSVRVRSGSGVGSGTGFLIDRDGTVVTNSHVVGDAKTVQVRLDDGRDFVSAEVRGTDPSTDLAVVKLDAGDVAGITPLQLAESDTVKVGDRALAIGYPLGLDRTATSGIISGIGRRIEAPNGFSIDKVIQTDAPINPGNSGGPLLDAAGRVIGVNSQIATAGGGGGNVGIGFAVPSDTVRQVVPRLLAGEKIDRAYLGVSTADPLTAGVGAEVATVVSGGPADRGGVRRGDTIVRVGDQAISGSDDVAAAISGNRPGDQIEIRVRRNGDVRTLQVTLGTRPETTP